MRNREKPGRKFPLRIVGVQRAEGLHERILGQLLGPPRVPDHPRDQAENRPLIAQDDLAKRRLGPIERSTNQFDVGGRHALCFSTGKSRILLQKPTTNSAVRTVKPVVQLTTRPFRITDVFAKALDFCCSWADSRAVTGPAAGSDGARGPSSAPVRITTPPKLDGILDDEAWSGDPLPLDGWISYNPMRGEAPAEKTQVWVGYDAEALYLAFRCLDTQPEKIRTTISRRDNAFSDDWVGVSLDSSRAGQLAYHLFVNPSGIQMDALQSGSSGEDFAPDWVWQSAGHVGADGWSVEIRVPLENIRFRSGADVRMGVLFWRRLSRTGVSASWPEMPDGKWVFESNGAIVFDELQSRRLLEMIPSATFSGNQARSDRVAVERRRGRAEISA